jgi:DcmR-like sensory protein
VADFLADGMAAGQPTMIIATPEHCDGLVNELTARRFDLTKLQRAGTVSLLDAQKTLETFMVGGRPNPGAFKEVLGAAIDRACWFSGEPVVRAYGEMVDVLWRAGNCDGAIQLELLWNELAHQYDFSLLCGYATGPSMKSAGRAQVCAVHTHVYDAVG